MVVKPSIASSHEWWDGSTIALSSHSSWLPARQTTRAAHLAPERQHGVDAALRVVAAVDVVAEEHDGVVGA